MTPPDPNSNPRALTRKFYGQLWTEVHGGKSGLRDEQLTRLREHYPVMMAPDRYPVALVTTIYTQRRAPAVAAILATERPVVFDAGCGYGSESFLFAALGAKVLAVDTEAEKIAIARARKPYFERHFDRSLDIEFEVADLDHHTPVRDDISITWIASVLANVPSQDSFLTRLHGVTRPGGQVMITDMNLLNPLFLWKEHRRRRQGAQRSSDFAREADFGAMFWRRNRRGARYFPTSEGGDPFDDAQFFWRHTLARLLRQTGFDPGPTHYSGFVPPLPGLPDLSSLEPWLDHIPVIRCGAYFYLMSGFKSAPTGPDNG